MAIRILHTTEFTKESIWLRLFSGGVFKIIERNFECGCPLRNNYPPKSVYIIHFIVCAVIIRVNSSRTVQLLRINFRAVLKLHGEYAVVLAGGRFGLLRLCGLSADLNENHGIKVDKAFVIVCTDISHGIFILWVKLAPNLLFRFFHLCGVTHKVFKWNRIEAVYIFGIIHIFRIVHAIFSNKRYFSVKLFLRANLFGLKIRFFYYSLKGQASFQCSLPSAKECIFFRIFFALNFFEVIKGEFKLRCSLRNSHLPKAVRKVKRTCRVLTISIYNISRICKLLRIDFLAVLILYGEYAVVACRTLCGSSCFAAQIEGFHFLLFLFRRLGDRLLLLNELRKLNRVNFVRQCRYGAKADDHHHRQKQR